MAKERDDIFVDEYEASARGNQPVTEEQALEHYRRVMGESQYDDMEIEELSDEDVQRILAESDKFDVFAVEDSSEWQNQEPSENQEENAFADLDDAIEQIEAEEVTPETKEAAKANPLMRKLADLVSRLYTKMQDMGLIEKEQERQQTEQAAKATAREQMARQSKQVNAPTTPDLRQIVNGENPGVDVTSHGADTIRKDTLRKDTIRNITGRQQNERFPMNGIRDNAVSAREQESRETWSTKDITRQMMTRIVNHLLDTSDYTITNPMLNVDRNYAPSIRESMKNYLSSGIKNQAMQDVIGDKNMLAQYSLNTVQNESFVSDTVSMDTLRADSNENARLHDTAALWNRLGDVFQDAADGKVSHEELAKLSIRLQAEGVHLREKSVGLPGGASDVHEVTNFDSRGIWLDLAVDDQLMLSRKGYNMDKTGEFLAHMGKITAFMADGSMTPDQMKNIANMMHSRAEVLEQAADMDPMERYTMCREMGEWGAPDKYSRENVLRYTNTKARQNEVDVIINKQDEQTARESVEQSGAERDDNSASQPDEQPVMVDAQGEEIPVATNAATGSKTQGKTGTPKGTRKKGKAPRKRNLHRTAEEKLDAVMKGDERKGKSGEKRYDLGESVKKYSDRNQSRHRGQRGTLYDGYGMQTGAVEKKQSALTAQTVTAANEADLIDFEAEPVKSETKRVPRTEATRTESYSSRERGTEKSARRLPDVYENIGSGTTAEQGYDLLI